MLSDAMTFYGLLQDFQQAGYFPTTHNEQFFEALKSCGQRGQLVVLSGIVGCGKTTLLRRIQATCAGRMPYASPNQSHWPKIG